MKLRIGQYAPSAQFTSLALSLLLAAGVVSAAYAITSKPKPTLAVDTSAAQKSDATSWQAALDAEQAANASSSITPPSTGVVNQLLQAAQSPNVTDTVARTLLINISNAKSQGLGDDVPTQDQITAAAREQAASVQAATVTQYGYTDLTVVTPSAVALHTYGNAVMQALSKNSNASEQATLLAIDEIVEGGDASKAQALKIIGAAYAADAKALTVVPVPQTFAPLHLQAINNLVSTAATFEDMENISTDAVRGLRGLQAYESLMDANAVVFTNIAEELQKDGILFTKDEPGNAWSVLLPASSVPITASPSQ